MPHISALPARGSCSPAAKSKHGKDAGSVRSWRLRARLRTRPGAALQRPGECETRAGRARSRQHVQVLLPLPVRDDGQVLLPLVTLVVHVDIVETAGQRTADDVVGRERLEGLPEMGGHPRDLAALVENVVDGPLLRWARVELALDPVESGL